MKYVKIDHMDFMCSHCQILTTVKCEPKYWGERFYRYVENYQPNHCPNCGFSVPPIYIDPDIAESIVILNRKNWFTKFCCSGHINSHRRVEFPYVMFENPLPLDVVGTLPKTWYLDGDFVNSLFGGVVRAHADNAIKAGTSILPVNIAHEYRDEILPNAIDDFNKWVLALDKLEPIDEYENVEIIDFLFDSCLLARIDGFLYTLDFSEHDDDRPNGPKIRSYGYDADGCIKFGGYPPSIEAVVDRYINNRYIAMLSEKPVNKVIRRL